jgi:hypothetical protein
VRVAVQKLPGVESVSVSLERASTDVQLRPGNAITLDQLRGIIKNNGFTAKEATVIVVGTLIERGGQPALEVTGTSTVLLLVADPKRPGIFKDLQQRAIAKTTVAVRLTGMVESRAGSADRLTVHGLGEP